MPSTKPLPATDSASDLRSLTGDDATAAFETDPRFVDSNPGAEGSSENVEEQRDTDDTADSDDEIEDADDLDDLEDDQDEGAASPALRADGLLGQEDELEDEAKKSKQQSADVEEDDDAGDVDMGVDEDELDQDDMDTDKVTAASVPFELVLNLMNVRSERRI
jgi:hypothetical protein